MPRRKKVFEVAAPGWKQQKDKVDDLIERTMDHLSGLLKACEGQLEAGDLTGAVVQSAALARAVSLLSAEMRAREKHVKLALEELTDRERDSLIQTYVSQLTPERREAHIQFVAGIAERELLLS